MAEEKESLGTVPPEVHTGLRGFLGRLVGAIAAGLLLAKVGSVFAQGKGATGRAAQPAGTAGPLSTLDGDAWLGEINLVAFNFAPPGWATCDGQLLPINQNQALFSLLGTTYGGNGQTTFALPDLRGRAPIHMGQGTGLTIRDMGELGGEESHTLSVTEIPQHKHTLMADSAVGSSDTPANAAPAKNAAGVPQYSTNPAIAMNANSVGLTGGGAAHNNMPPFLTMNYIIAINGIFPPRS